MGICVATGGARATLHSGVLIEANSSRNQKFHFLPLQLTMNIYVNVQRSLYRFGDVISESSIARKAAAVATSLGVSTKEGKPVLRVMLVPTRPGGTRQRRSSASHKVRGGCRWRQHKVQAVPVKSAAVVNRSHMVQE